MTEKTKVAVLEEFNKPLQIREVEVPQLRPGQILVRIASAGICGSDVHMQKGKDPRVPLPIILGHEGVGRIVQMDGEKKSVLGEKLRVGDMIIWNRGVSCGDCYYCAVAHQPALCEDRWAYGIHHPMTIPPHLNGCYAEHIILSEDTDIFLVGDLDPAVFVPVACSGATAAHAFEYAEINPGDVVMVQGPGPLGIFLVAFAKSSGASSIIVIGGTQDRLRLCMEFGATHILNRHTCSEEQIKETVMSVTGGRGVDVAFEASGSISAVMDGVPLVRNGGTYISVGFGEPSGSVKFPWFETVIRKNLTIQGVWVSDTRHIFSALRLVQSNYDKFLKMITHRFRLEDVNYALESVAERQAVKSVLIP